MLRRALLAAFVLAAAGCGGTATGSGGDAGDALGYIAADSATVVLVSTDVDDDQWQQFDERVFRKLDEDNQEHPQTFEEYAEDTAEDAGLDWKDDVKPLLGNDMVVGIEGDATSLLGGEGESSVTAALDTRGGDIEEVLKKAKLERAGEANGATLYREPGGNQVLLGVEDGVLIGAQDEKALRRALERRDNGGGLEDEAVKAAFSDLPQEALVRAFGSLEGLRNQEELRRFAEIPLVQASRRGR